MNEIEIENENKEEFCLACAAAVPLAFSMVAGTNEISNDDNEEDEYKQNTSPVCWYHIHRKNRKLHISIIIGLISLSVIIYFKFIKQCDECK